MDRMMCANCGGTNDCFAECDMAHMVELEESQPEDHIYNCGRCGFSEATVDGSHCNYCSECCNCGGMCNPEEKVCCRCGIIDLQE